MENEAVICITTRNRPHDFKRCYESVKDYGYRVIVVDDASDVAYCKSHYRFETRAGIPRSKNKCLELAMQTDAEHIFLLDDDMIALDKDSFKRYIESPFDHLCYTFLNGFKFDTRHKKHTLGNGCMMYLKRLVIDEVGGFDTDFGYGKYEHKEYSERVHHSGLTPYPFIDLIGSDELFYCLDQDRNHARTMTESEMKYLLSINYKIYKNKFGSTEFVNYL